MKHPLGHFPCEQCKKRNHPMDQIANMTDEQRAELADMAQRARDADTTIKRTSAEWEEYNNA